MAIRSLSASPAPVNKNSDQVTQTQNCVESRTDGSVFGLQFGSATRPLAKTLAASMLALFVFGSSGCSLMSGGYRAVKHSSSLDNCMIGYRNRVLAARAWHERAHCYKKHRFKNDFEAGFLQGYADVANGGNGCVPAVAPAQYLGWRYQSADGQGAINAFFQGYPLGAAAAEADGIGHWGDVRPSQSQRPRQAVFRPTGRRATESVNREPRELDPYPYEPAPEDEMDEEDDIESAADDPIREALDTENPLGDDDIMDLDDTGASGDADDVGDAIREALDAAPGDDDSASNTFGGVPQATVAAPVTKPVYDFAEASPSFNSEPSFEEPAFEEPPEFAASVPAAQAKIDDGVRYIIDGSDEAGEAASESIEDIFGCRRGRFQRPDRRNSDCSGRWRAAILVRVEGRQTKPDWTRKFSHFLRDTCSPWVAVVATSHRDTFGAFSGSEFRDDNETYQMQPSLFGDAKCRKNDRCWRSRYGGQRLHNADATD